MKQVRKLLTMGVLLLMLLSLSACQKEEGETSKKEKPVVTKQEDVEDAASTENPKEPVETESTDVVSEATGTFDFEKIRQNIVISGKQVSMPFCLDDLGEGYEFNEIGRSEWEGEEKTSVGLYLPDGNEIFTIVKEKRKEEVDAKSEVITVMVNTTEEESVSIDGIIIGESSENIKKKYGEPTQIIEKMGIYGWYYEGEKGRIHFAIQDEKVFSMTVEIY